MSRHFASTFPPQVRDWYPYLIVMIFAIVGPLWALLAWYLAAVTGGGRFATIDILPLAIPVAYFLEGVPSFLIGVVAAVSFQLRAQVFLRDVVAASLVIGFGHLIVLRFMEGRPLIQDLVHGAPILVFPICAGLGCWLLVRTMRKRTAA